ncbi:glycosyltransferase family 2 protein [Metabacillus fastidiosus]|uniref:glycosyltransferase family 2 protein n=1 Tax=Metabacillus fastidiosus TaxID=1458 RepID=UPI003D2E1FEF
MKRISVSVIIPSYNSTDTIERAVSSVSRQTILPKEIIIIDDCSTDERIEDVMKSLEQKYNSYFDIKIIKNTKNQGPGVSRNIGWNSSKEDYIAFLDSDDAWHERKIELQYEYMISNPDVDFSCHENIVVLDETACYKEEVSQVEITKEECITFRQLLFKNTIATRTVMLKRKVGNKFQEGKYHSEDYLLWLEIASSGYKMIKLNAPLSKCFNHPFLGDGLSGNLLKMFKGELDSYRRLIETKRIDRKGYILVVGYSTIRFIRRLYFSMIFKKKRSNF